MHLNDEADTKYSHTCFQNATSMSASQFYSNFLKIFEHQLRSNLNFFLRSYMFFPEMGRWSQVKGSLIFLTLTISQNDSVKYTMICFNSSQI